MNNTSRVSHIAAGSSIETSYGRDSSRGGTNSGEGGRGRDLGLGNMVSSHNRSHMVSNGSHMVSHRGHMVSNRGHMVGSKNRGSHMGSSNMVSSRISHTMVASKSSIASISHNIGISLSFSLGHMDNTSRVSNIAAGSSIHSSYSRDSSRVSTSSGEGGRGRHLGVASGDMVSCRYNR